MKVIVLSENTAGKNGCGTEHGLCLYIETASHRLLFDTGASGLFLENAKKLGVDIASVDTVILSHGHYDHGGGIRAFLSANDHASIYVPEAAFGPYYSIHSDGPHYIGLDTELKDCPRLISVGDKLDIDAELHLFSDIPANEPVPSANESLKVREGDNYVPDSFRHEQCLAVREQASWYLFTGCAHHGILNILNAFRNRYRTSPDAVFGGFHMMKRNGYTDTDIQAIIDTALALRKTDTIFYTCHCTGTAAYEGMKKIMEKQLTYLHSGDTAELKPRKRQKPMHLHKLFAWGTVICFAMTMITGYKHK